MEHRTSGRTRAVVNDPTSLHRLSAAIDRLGAHAGDWSTHRLLDEGLDLVRDASWADSCALLRIDADTVVTVHGRPVDAVAATGPVSPAVPVDWFPWGLAPVRADRFLLVDDARLLPVSPEGGSSLADHDVRSCLHLPIRERGATVGALHVLWSEPRLAWDDDRGRLLRSLGRFLLTCRAADPVADPR
jgi:GAF domain-containing protein